MTVIARSVRIAGRVQGVFFRAWTQDQARRLGVAGWVRNCADGSVEARLEGEAGDVERMIGLLRQGPPQARVDDIEVEDAACAGPAGFCIRR